MSISTPACSIAAITGISGISICSNTSSGAGGFVVPHSGSTAGAFGFTQQFRAQLLDQRVGAGGIGSGIGRGQIDSDLIHRDLVLALADQLVDLGHAPLAVRRRPAASGRDCR